MRDKEKINIWWIRRDLRLEDNSTLYQAANTDRKVLPVFIYDTDILEKLPSISDRRVDYIQQAVTHINSKLRKHHSGVWIASGTVLNVFKKLISEFDISEVHCGEDYEPYARVRDQQVESFLQHNGISFFQHKDQVIFSKNEISKADGTPYHIFTPYARKWKENFHARQLYQNDQSSIQFVETEDFKTPTLKELGFKKTDIQFKKPEINTPIIRNYDKYRDYPFEDKTSHLGMALRFGTISIRKCIETARDLNQIWLSELIWREFFMQILYHYPKVVSQSFKPNYDRIRWRNNEDEFQAWCEGKTGYPLVDAGMRELNQTGFMHNRVRMIAASFLCKHLLIDWRWGESYFAEKLNDYELSSNNGNWQWAAGTGCDSAPYFRIFNPTTQAKKFDPELKYIKKWLDADNQLIPPIVDHAFARERALKSYREALDR